MQVVWPWVQPYLDDRATSGARRVGLPDDEHRLASLVPTDELAAFAAALVRVSLLAKGVDALGNEPLGNAAAGIAVAGGAVAGAAPSRAVVE